jgi:hypothetical protein
MRQATHDWDFFIAYANQDVQIATRLHDLLEPARVFLDRRNLVPGDSWPHELARAQEHSRTTLVLVSSHSATAHYLIEEIAAAVRLTRSATGPEHRVVPLLIERDVPLPYGLETKQALPAYDDDSLLAAVATLLQLGLGPQPIGETEPGEPPGRQLESALSVALSVVDMTYLLEAVLSPLAEVLHPGHSQVAQVASAGEASGLISTGFNALKRPDVLYIHPFRAQEIDSELTTHLERIVSDLNSEGVVDANGRRYHPDEVWFLLTKKTDSLSIARLSMLSSSYTRGRANVVTVGELSTLLVDSLPAVATRLARYSSPDVLTFMSTLGRHTEARAFGLSNDRQLDDFYITTALAPHFMKAKMALSGQIADPVSLDARVPIKELIEPGDLLLSDDDFVEVVSRRAWNLLNTEAMQRYRVTGTAYLQEPTWSLRSALLAGFHLTEDDILDATALVTRLRNGTDSLSRYLWEQLTSDDRARLEAIDLSISISGPVRASIAQMLERVISRKGRWPKSTVDGAPLGHRALSLQTRNLSREQGAVLNRLVVDDCFQGLIQRYSESRGKKARVTLALSCAETFAESITSTKLAISQCPAELGADAEPIKTAWACVRSLDDLIKSVESDLKVQLIPPGISDRMVEPVRVRAPEPARLLALDPLLLVEGMPGCGKTTLLKMLTLSVMGRRGDVIHIRCSEIGEEYISYDLDTILRKCGKGGTDATPGTLLIVDGLDEAAFDISGLLLEARERGLRIVASTRSAYHTRLRSTAFVVALAPFSSRERDAFFDKWFGSENELREQARDLVQTYRDIDIHTRLPLIATITGALLQSGIAPRTRSEIYGFRLDLLLSRWDKSRGVNRLNIDNPDAKRRFLRFLAHELHCAKPRKRTITSDELGNVYEKSLGEWGYRVGVKRVLDDLVLGSGVLFEERKELYSLGHLTFQEHLVAEYIVREYSEERIANLLGEDWWREPLRFYASMKGDIGNLLNYVMTSTQSLAYSKQLLGLARAAPYTAAGAVDAFLELARADVE